MRRLIGYWLLLLLTCSAGCGNGLPERAAVSGTVEYAGQPVPNVVVTFHPLAGGRSAVGTTDSVGRFTLSTFEPGDGALLGEHAVTVVPQFSGSAVAVSVDASDAYSPPPKGFLEGTVPPRYADRETSGLQFDVTTDGPHVFAVKLDD